jgi:hypothetical protein
MAFNLGNISSNHLPMKKRNILMTALLLSGSVILFSCSKNNYPKKVIVVNDNNPQGLPPGQAKKINGTQSAKPYAPGQQKKNGGTTVVIK